MTALGGRPVQAAAPPDERPSARRARTGRQDSGDDGAVAEREAREDGPKPAVKQAPDEARRPNADQGSAAGVRQRDRRHRRVRGQGFGLSTAGGEGPDRRSEITGDFCCPDHLRR